MAVQKNVKAGGIATVMIGAAIIAAHFILPFESTKYTAYQDSVGIWSICTGHTEGVQKGQTATKKQCDAWYAHDIETAQDIYDGYVHHENPDNVKAAAISFIFNVGGDKFIHSTLLKKLNKGDRAGACNEFIKWRYVGGKDCAVRSNNCYGLVTRRQAERDLCLDQHIYTSYGPNSDNIFVGQQKD